ncbi:MAG: RHS repeat-associated core domain-containing protein [Hafnia alvei]|nr:RHS repeat-associated core domain-containing protein [Hafnia alvei]
MYYNRYRYYDGESGQYVSPDPIGLAGGSEPLRVCIESAEIY